MKWAKSIGLIFAFFSGLSAQAQADSVLCHITYGGEKRQIESLPVDSPYLVATKSIGTFFLFRVVYQTQPADLASIKIYTYADRDGGPVIIHQASYPASIQNAAVNGFTGLNWVYEPLRDGELQYWCEIQTGEKTK